MDDLNAKVSAAEVPDLEGVDVLSAKRFFAALARVGALFHADDDPFDVVDGGGYHRLFDDAAAAKVSGVLARLREASGSWPDPDFLYALCGMGEFAVEADYPGFVMDAGVVASIGMNYPSVPERPLPTFIAHDGAGWFAVEAPIREGRFSEMRDISVIPAVSVRERADGRFECEFDRGAAVLAEDFSKVDAVIESFSTAVVRPGR